MKQLISSRLLTLSKLVLVLFVVCAVIGVSSGMAQAATDANIEVDISPLPNRGANNAGTHQIKTILGVTFSIVAAISLLMVTIGGFRYVASQGDPQAATRAKGTITYALVGLLVSISAVLIVSFFVGKL